MRTTVGVIAVLGLAVAVADAQPPRERAAAFRPPEAIQPGDVPAVARGAADEFPPSSFLPGTPVSRPKAGVAGPAWLTGADPDVVPAAGSVSKSGGVRALTPPATAPRVKDESVPALKGFDRSKGATPPRPQPAAQPQQPPEQPTAASPFRGTSATGAPVYAGPPAYRWYGWGTVTPGANQFAPAGQYPRASANWYAITGATPGAFPVPVMNPLRTPPGTEPPSYGTARAPAPQSVVPAATQSQPPFQPPLTPRPQPAPASIERPEPPKLNPTTDTKSPPGGNVGLAPVPPVNVPKLTPPPLVPAPVAAKEPAPVLVSPPAMPEPVSALPPLALPLLPSLPTLPAVEPAAPVAVVAPTPLPISMIQEPKPNAPKQVQVKPEAPRHENQHWQPSAEPAEPRPGTWAPAGDAGTTGARDVKPVVARGQMPDNNADPIAEMIRQMCKGRADGVEVRPAGTKKLMVCFETRTAGEAQKLVADISRRPELAPYQIDFCVVVK